jgi:hypothetical protein
MFTERSDQGTDLVPFFLALEQTVRAHPQADDASTFMLHLHGGGERRQVYILNLEKSVPRTQSTVTCCGASTMAKAPMRRAT